MVLRRPGPPGDHRPSQRDGPEAETETYAYPAPGEYTTTDADGNTTAIFHDDQGNLGETIDALGNITRYAYDANDNLVKLAAADGTTTTYSYDANGNMTSETDPLGYTIEFNYNQFAEPITFVNQEGYTTSYQYDASGNLLGTDEPRRHDPARCLQLPRRGDLVNRRRWRHDHVRIQLKRTAHGRESGKQHVKYLHVRCPRQHADRRRPRRGLVVHVQQRKPTDDDR